MPEVTRRDRTAGRAEAQDGERPAAAAAGDPSTLRVLLVDDDAIDRRALMRALRAAGIGTETRETDTVAGALALLEAETFDCVFLDYQLPGGDGMRVLREARATGLDTPIVMLTGQEDTQTAVELMKAGASDYIAKADLSPERIARSVTTVLRLQRAERLTRQAEQALRESEERFRVLHETSPDGFMIFRSVRDEAGRIVDFEWTYANPASAELVGRSATELLGRRLLVEMPGNREGGLFEAYCRVVETGDVWQDEFEYHYDGVGRWFRATAARLGDGFAVSFADISRRKQAELERERALEIRSRFFAAMSHELRTPINAIIGYNELLLDGIYGEINEKQHRGLDRSQRAARHLLDLVNDVLDLSKLEAGKMELVVEPVHLDELVQDLFATVRPLAEQRQTPLTERVEGCIEPILTDPRRVRQILLNLLSNAIKFGEGRPVEAVCRKGADGGVVVEIIDHGAGIADADLERIFEEFVQLPNIDQGGTGLGLPISKRLAEVLGGELVVSSRSGEGSRFTLTLPHELESPADPA
jgi:PAS domain S-box-containing protein